jgi:LPPG:FO 2-phospho-L-lactate transferase
VITVLAGGVGAARFLRGLTRVVPADEVTAIVNVGDDLTLHGLRVCPDLDSITYWLAGVVHPEQQWGRADETTVVSGELARFGVPTWFTLGDRDLATHLYRTARLREGAPLSAVTAEVTAAFGVDVRLVPVTDDEVETRIETKAGDDLHFQEYWVRDRATPEVAAVRFAGADTARPAPGVLEAIRDAEVIVVAPSNPVVSVAPILAVPGVRTALTASVGPGRRRLAHRRRHGRPRHGPPPAARRRGRGERCGGGRLLRRPARRLGRRRPRRGRRGDVEAAGIRCVATDTLMDDPDVAAALARTCLELAGRR